ncbi:unnamed protein product [Phytomonas sp. Hart1]|nr:unnamed protein product [Phytomonas sp. Hart1]|eukprot:CCW66836.1 unnamed protein product [Phytomonas sp. isolate Hart1]
MNKVVITTYRRLLKMCSQVDNDIALRSMLSCTPIQVYNHSINEWVPLNVGKLSSWQDSRIFFDNLIRRLNNIRQFYIPPTLREEAVAAMNLHNFRMVQQKTEATVKGGEAGKSERDEPMTKASSSTSTPEDGPNSNSTSTGSKHSDGTSITHIPLDVKPYDLLCPTLRFFLPQLHFPQTTSPIPLPLLRS